MIGDPSSIFEAARAPAAGGPRAVEHLTRAFAPQHRSRAQRFGERVGPYLTAAVLTAWFAWVLFVLGAVSVWAWHVMTGVL